MRCDLLNLFKVILKPGLIHPSSEGDQVQLHELALSFYLMSAYAKQSSSSKGVSIKTFAVYYNNYSYYIIIIIIYFKDSLKHHFFFFTEVKNKNLYILSKSSYVL